MKNNEIRLDYEPRQAFVPFHQRRQRRALLVAHRRAGKTVAGVNDTIARALQSTLKRPQYFFIMPFRQQAKRVAWHYLKDATNDFAIETRVSDLSVTLPNEATITLTGSDNIDALRGMYSDGVILDEFADARPNLWEEVILPTLADRNGWAVITSTPKGHNQFYDMYRQAQQNPDIWYLLMLKASQSGLINPETLEQMKLSMSEFQYAQELECSFDAPVIGTYYAQEISLLEQKGKVKYDGVKHNPNYQVHMATDLGYSDTTAFWFWQEVDGEINIIRAYENAGEPLRHYFDYLDHLILAEGYDFNTFWLPHDARAKTLQTGRSVAEQFIEHFKESGINIDITPMLKVNDGIAAVRKVLPNCNFNSNLAFDGIEALRKYRRQFSKLTNSFADKPLHDEASNFADAFRYLALVAKYDKMNDTERLKNRREKIIVPTYGTLNNMFAEREQHKPRVRI